LVIALMVATLLWIAAVVTAGLAQGTGYTVNLATVTIAGKSETILVDGNGMALYYLTSDRPAVSACAGGCATTWPPLLSATAPTGPSSLPGKLAVVSTGHGAQVTYNGHLLYRYAGDARPGQVNGHNRSGPGGGRWLVATADLKVGGNEAPGESGDQRGGY
jgi:predicted lipoprotein with Yx(FWY)xxD motif